MLARKICIRLFTRLLVEAAQRDIIVVHSVDVVVCRLTHKPAVVHLPQGVFVYCIHALPQPRGVVEHLILVHQVLCFKLCVGNVVHPSQCGEPCVVALSAFGCKVLQRFLPFGVRLLVFVEQLLGIPLSHFHVALQSVLCHHVVRQLGALVCRLRKSCHLLKHRFEQLSRSRVHLVHVHRRKAVLAKVGILEAIHLFDMQLLALRLEYRAHGFFQSEHAVLQRFLRLIQSALQVHLICVARHSLPVFPAVAVAKHDIVVRNFFARNLGVLEILYHLCGRRKS